MKKKTPKFNFEADPSYRELVANIRKEMDDAYVKGVDFNREHFLNCFVCECFEGMSKKAPGAFTLRMARPPAWTWIYGA